MGVVRQLPAAQAGLRRAGATIVERYRGIAHTKWDGRWYNTPYYVAVTALDEDLDPAFAAMSDVAFAANPPQAFEDGGRRVVVAGDSAQILAVRPIAVCHGARGWVVKYRRGMPAETAVHVFARANGKTYLASTQFDDTNGDVFRAERAVETLCPPGAEPAVAPDPAAQLHAPQHWIAVDPSSVPQIGGEMDTRLLWAHLSQHWTLEELVLAQAADVDENVTPEQESDFMRQAFAYGKRSVRVLSSRTARYCGVRDAWASTFEGVALDGYRYRLDAEYGYDRGMSYAAAYVHRADLPQDPAALQSLRSFCPADR